MAAGGLSLSSLTEEFQEAKKRLKEVEEGIQKHTGRPSLQQRYVGKRTTAEHQATISIYVRDSNFSSLARSS